MTAPSGKSAPAPATWPAGPWSHCHGSGWLCRRSGGLLALLLFTIILAGCSSIGHSWYTSPQVTGRVLAADTRRPLPRATVRRVVSYPTDGEDTAPKGGMLQMRSSGRRVNADGRFVVDAVKVATLFRHGAWHSVAIVYECAGYERFETNYSAAVFTERSPEDVPLVNAGDVFLTPASKESTP